jgi:hypothetical protein
VIFLDENLNSAYRDAHRYYPNATFKELYAPGGDGIVLWQIILSPDDMLASQGVVARYYEGETVKGVPAYAEVIPQILLDWTQTQPLGEPFTVQMQSTLFAQKYGDYRFQIRGDDSVDLWIDENAVGDAPITLARGLHQLRMQVKGGGKQVQLWWQPPESVEPEPIPGINLFLPPVTNNGLLGRYFRSPDWSGPPAFTQIDPELDYYFHVIPFPRPYSIEWAGKLYASVSGDYKIALRSIDASRLLLDQQFVLENSDGETITEASIYLNQGLHDIVVNFADKTAGTRIYLYWTPPGSATQELIPSNNLFPPMGRYPENVQSGSRDGNK